MPDTLFDSSDDAALAAALAAVERVLAEEALATTGATPLRSAWRAAAMLEAQGFAAGRGAEQGGAWRRTAQVARARRWSKGIVGS